MAVRGTFDLNDRPAVDGLGRVKRAGLETDAVMEQLGKTIDKVFSERNAEEARAYTRDLNGVRDATLEVDAALRSLGAIDARPNINLRGVTEANAQIDALELRLRRLGGINARPGVNVGTHGRVGGGGGSARTGSGFGGGGLDIPFAGKIPWGLVAGALGAAPPLLGGAAGLLGSAAGAGLGAGAIGVAGYATAGVGAALAAPTAIASISGIKEASKALAAYQAQVIQTGPNSKAAAAKLREYNMAAAAAPGATEFLKARTLLGREFNAATKPGQEAVAGIGTRGVNLGRQLLPTFAPLSNQFLQGAQQQTGNFADFLTTDRSKGFINSMGNEAINDLGPLEQTMENVAGTIENIAQASRPFFHEGVLFLEKWTGGWEKSTHDLNSTRKDIGGMVDDLKSWGHLGGAGFDLIEDLLKPASGSGTSMVDDLTGQLETWDKWVKDNPREISAFFEKSAEGTEKIASGLGRITTLLFKTGQQLTPLVEEASNLITTLDNAGLLTPGALPLLLAGGAGVRAGRNGLGNRIRGGTAMGGGVIPVGVGGRGSTFGSFGADRYGASLGTRELGSAYALEREAGLGRIGAATTVARSTAVGGAAETVGRGFLGSFLPYLAVSGGLGALGSEGNALERLRNGLSQASMGLISPIESKAQQQEKGYAQGSHIANTIIKGKGTLQQKQHRLYNAVARTYVRAEGGMPYEEMSASEKLYVDSNGSEGAKAPHYGLSEQEEQARVSALGKARKSFRSYAGEARVERAQGLFSDITGAFEARQEGGVKGAGRTSIEAIENQAKTMHGATARAFEQTGLDWAKELAKANPKLKGVVNEMAEGIENRLTRMGNQFKLINGQIVNVTESAWPKVRNIITSETAQAEKEAGKNLSAIEQQAFAVLKHMGYSSGQAQSLVHESLTGKPTKTGGRASAEAAHHGGSAPTMNNQPGLNQATGGRIPYNGSLHDTVPIPGGGYAAGGELVFTNRHTERRVDRMLGKFGTSLSREISNEGRAHSEPFRSFDYATGGRRKGGATSSWRGVGAAGLHQGIRTVAGAVLGQFPGLSVTSTTGGTHVSGSLHYAGEAVDIGGDTQSMFDASNWIKQSGLYRQLNEGIHNPNLAVNEGRIESGEGVYGGVWAEHANHIHLGVTKAIGQIGRLASGAGRGAGPAGAAGRQSIRLHSQTAKRGGLPGAIVSRSNQMQTAGLERNINKLLGKRGGGLAGGSAPPGGSQTAVERQIFRVLSSAGANRVGAAGIIGNAYAESTMIPGAEGTGGGGLWGFTSGAISLANLKKAGGGSWESPAFQTRFMLQNGGQGLIPALNKAGSPEAAARLFMEQWEKPGIPRLPVREEGARTAFGQGFATGGRRAGFAGWFKNGGHFRVKNPTMFGAGEGGVAEDVTIRPAGRTGTGGGHTFHISVDMRGAHVGDGASARSRGKEVADKVAEELAAHLESSDGVSERSLTG